MGTTVATGGPDHPVQQRRQHLTEIFRAGLARVDPYQAIRRQVRRNRDQLLIRTDAQSLDVNLGRYQRILLLGAGKASAPMARAFEELLKERISGGLICVKEGHGERLGRVEICAASHPVPDQRGFEAARRMMDLARHADAGTLVINCISGGGSALLPCPIDLPAALGRQITLADKQATTAELLRCGASIRQINCIRKHISAIKGGRLLQLIAPARSLNFILSDVVGDDLGSIASGMTSADDSTYAEALAIIDGYQLRQRIPASVLAALELGAAGELPETLKPGAAALQWCDNILVGSNRQALLAARRKARELGYRVLILSAQIEGESRHVARTLADIARDAAISELLVKKPACLLLGGETVVTVTGAGQGGRNQEMALAFLRQMRSWSARQLDTVSFLAASTDGNDGPTDAAGAFADRQTLDRASAAQLDMDAYLAANDSYHFFAAAQSLLRTGPTNTNVCDMQIILLN